jgi:molybdopterin-guanine dinucleotide biosynthesis protein A
MPETETAPTPALEAGFVLAGGQSRRMGRDKALEVFGGRPLIEIALETLRQAGVQAGIAGARSELSGFAAVVDDPEPDQGPLAGICAAMEATSAERVVFIPVDLPLLPASLVACMVSHARITGRAVTLASVNGFAQTFPAVLNRAALPFLEHSRRSGQSGCYSAFQVAAAGVSHSVSVQQVSVLPVEVLAQTGQATDPGALPPAWWFLNVNSPSELARAESIVAASKSRSVDGNCGLIA